MKKKGNVCDYTSQRNAELCASFRRHIHEASFIDLDVIFRKVASSPASRFFISEQRANLIIADKRRSGAWNVRNPQRLEMLREIERIANTLFRSGRYTRFADAIFDAVNSPAPSFYLTPRSARTIIYSTISTGN